VTVGIGIGIGIGVKERRIVCSMLVWTCITQLLPTAMGYSMMESVSFLRGEYLRDCEICMLSSCEQSYPHIRWKM